MGGSTKQDAQPHLHMELHSMQVREQLSMARSGHPSGKVSKKQVYKKLPSPTCTWNCTA